MTARRYNAAWNCINTQSATLPLCILTGSATIQPEIYHYTIGSDATPASNATKYAWQRATTAGTWAGAGGAAITPQQINASAGTAIASGCTFNQGVCSVGPTLTANSFVHQVAINMQATIIVNFNDGAGLNVPSTASAGLALMSLVTVAAYNAAGTVMWSE
jgi:hypothetical protein